MNLGFFHYRLLAELSAQTSVVALESWMGLAVPLSCAAAKTAHRHGQVPGESRLGRCRVAQLIKRPTPSLRDRRLDEMPIPHLVTRRRATGSSMHPVQFCR